MAKELPDLDVPQSLLILLVILVATWVIFGKGKHAGFDERAAIDAAFLGTKGMNGVNGDAADAGGSGRDFVAEMKRTVSCLLSRVFLSASRRA